MDVKIKDRDFAVEITRMALNIVGVRVDYQITDLILKTLSELDKKKGHFSIEDGVKIEHEWREFWDNYRIEQKEEIV